MTPVSGFVPPRTLEPESVRFSPVETAPPTASGRPKELQSRFTAVIFEKLPFTRHFGRTEAPRGGLGIIAPVRSSHSSEGISAHVGDQRSFGWHP